MKLEVGKLYVCEIHLMLYPDQETAAAKAAAAAAAAATTIAAEALAATAAAAPFWSNRFGKPVFYIEKNIPILVLNSKEKFYEVLAGDRKGWIICEDRLNIKEIP